MLALVFTGIHGIKSLLQIYTSIWMSSYIFLLLGKYWYWGFDLAFLVLLLLPPSE